MGSTTVNRLILESLQQHDKADLLRYKRDGHWQKISSHSFLRQIASLAATLRELGIQKGDRVALFSENRPEWHIADLAVLGLGAVNVPIYPAESQERFAYILRHSESRLCFISRAEQFQKLQSVWRDLPRLETAIPFAGVGKEGGDPEQRVLAWEKAVREEISAEELEGFERLARSHQPDDEASLIYTSGTTGTPKGTLLTQRNFASQVVVLRELLQYQPDDLALSLLPLCHIYERTNCYVYLGGGCSVAYAEGFDKVIDNMQEVRPTLMAVVPRFFEKFYARLMERMQRAPWVKRRVFDWAVGVGRRAVPYRLAQKPVPGWLGIQHRLADGLVYSKLRAEIGGRMRCFISGAAPLSRDLNLFFHALGLTIFEGYGLTETSPVIAVNTPGQVKLGTVGRPIPGVEVKIAADGEILTRGPHVMKAYYKLEEETREVLRDGWLYTGDVGFVDADGFLSVTDRKRDLIKTAGGKFVAPQPIENRLKQSPYIRNAVVVGDRRKYVVVLLVPNPATLGQLAAERNIPFQSTAELLAHPSVRAVLQEEVDRVNQTLAQYERLKRFCVVEDDFSFSAGLITYTHKVRRRKIEEHYRGAIERLYEEEPRPAA
jgi:long-chain acyl-CoA synthetase